MKTKSQVNRFNIKLLKLQKYVVKNNNLKIFFKMNPKLINKFIVHVIFIKKILNYTKNFYSRVLFINRMKDILKNISHRTLKLLFIAKDSSRIDLIIWLPILCKVYNIPFIIMESKSYLGRIVNTRRSVTIGLKSYPHGLKETIEDLIALFKKIYYNDFYSKILIIY
uniref:Ribosomal protein L7a n=1 Tax=Amorphochlora amoebiformis TaxID=1561963 RepID=A0A0H5BKL4_9EUKA|nr:ribosomal protein L7a [Amorphochlora amoebiformis]